VAGGIAGVGLLVWAARSGPVERDAEDAAREFYAEHGRWPDEPA
jgi:hypothetical protein